MMFRFIAWSGIACVVVALGLAAAVSAADAPTTAPATRPSSVPATQPAKEMTLDLGDMGGKKITMKLVLIPAGTFTMGSPKGEKGRQKNETQHEVTISKPFYMGIYEVTQAQYAAGMGNDLSKVWGDDLLVEPASQISWDDAQEFCKKLSEKTGKTVRLPTEAEWEYACRAGEKGPYAGTGNLDEMGWHDKNSDGRSHPVGQKKLNAWGLYDMHGNLWEWCYDAYQDDITKETRDPKIDDPKIDIDASSRVFRGGSWRSSPANCRGAYRSGYSPVSRSSASGFRVCLDSP